MTKGLPSYPAPVVFAVVWVVCLFKNSHKTNKYTLMFKVPRSLDVEGDKGHFPHSRLFNAPRFKYKGKCPPLSQKNPKRCMFEDRMNQTSVYFC